MVIETKADLNPVTIDGLQQLIRVNIDSANGFKHIAGQTDSGVLRSTFSRIARDRLRQAKELAAYVAINLENPVRNESYAAMLHRCWISCREFISPDDLHALVAEAARGEEMIKQAYEHVLRRTAGSTINDVLIPQYMNVKVQLSQVQDLRDALAN